MEKDKIIILVEKENLNPEKLRSVIDVDGCGSVVSFVGLTRGEDNAIKVKRLELMLGKINYMKFLQILREVL